ncbi:hypothetical protein LC608_30390 [Nostoc sp. XA010]|uniref:hypothetical protein n=1 Tax=Nostoc sp. XA010 TaxID=2780407 RepID=UPI001E5E581C|nr:hypothetical protein [Nostoc sp. XA010]MCC5661196.1 hypothetical protein [Nostoc sp. XA010]
MDEEFFELEKKASLIGASLRQVDIEAGGADIYWLIMPDGEKIVCTELSQVSYNLSHWQCDKKGNFVMKKNFDWIKDPERRKQAES